MDDAAKFITKEGHDTYDVIIVDSSDPVGKSRCLFLLHLISHSSHYLLSHTTLGPAEALFKPEFFEALQAALSPGGIICTQAECQWLHLDFIANVYR